MTLPSNLRAWSGVPVGSVTMRSSAATTGASHAHNKLGIARPSIYPIADRHAYFKRNSGGRVIFGWNCTPQDVTSQASRISALRLIASGK